MDSNISEMSTDTVPTPSSSQGSLRIKQEPDTMGSLSAAASMHDNGPHVTVSTASASGGGDHHLNSIGGGHHHHHGGGTTVTEDVGPSPRKKPRKQQHM